MIVMVAVCLAGGLGAAARFMLDGAVRARISTRLPWATIAINTLGSLLIGAFAALLATDAIGAQAFTIAAMGFCGGFTTFSTAMVESVRLMQDEKFAHAAVNAWGTLALVVVAATAGWALVWAVAG